MHLDCFVDQPREDSSILIAGPDRFSLATERTYNSTLYFKKEGSRALLSSVPMYVLVVLSRHSAPLFLL